MNSTYWWKRKSRQRRLEGRALVRTKSYSEQQNTSRNFSIKIMNILLVLFIFPLLGFYLNGCTTKYSARDPDQKQALRTLAGGVAGILLAGNTGGAIVGALVVDIVSVATIKYEDKQLENGDQAAKRYKELEQKAEERKDQEKKAEDKKDQEKKAEDKKDQERKAEKKKFEEKRVKLIIEESSVSTHTVKTGATVKANMQYTLLTPDRTEHIKITETRRLRTAYSTREVDTRDISRSQGTFLSSVQFTLPEDMPKGYCILYTTVTDGKREKTAQSVLNIL